MEQRVVVRFFTLKRLNPQDIHTELFSVYGSNVFVLSMIYKRHQLFADWRTELCDDPRSRGFLHGDLAEVLGVMFRKCPLTLARGFVSVAYYSVITLCLIWFKTSEHIAGERSWKASSCIWVMHIFTIRGNLVNISNDFVPVEFCIQPTSRIWSK
jgi:hypothetical protein